MMEIDHESSYSKWNFLPELLLYEVYSYLPLKDKISASSTCKHWRRSLFYPSFWKTFKFSIMESVDDKERKAKFLKSTIGKKIRNAFIVFSSLDQDSLEAAVKLLANICNNKHLKNLLLVPSHCRLYPVKRTLYWERHVFHPLCMLLEKSSQFEGLSLGCLEELVFYCNKFVKLASKYHSNSIQMLGLASLKYDPDRYFVGYVDYMPFMNFINLEILSLDFDVVNDGFLYALCSCVRLKRLVLHIHGNSHYETSDAAWVELKKCCPNLELRMNLIHSFDIIWHFEISVLRPSMPLTHVRAFFCERLNLIALDLLIHWYAKTLQCLWWVDSFDSPDSDKLVRYLDASPRTNYTHEINPFIFAAWRCANLNEIVIHGYKYLAEDIFGISRLRGHTLKNLQLSSSDMVFTKDCPISLSNLESEVSDWLGRPWRALRDDELHSVIRNRLKGASDEYILPVVLNDLQ